MNGVFVNDVKVQSTLLSHGDILTIGGLGQKIPIGTMFAQPEAEFIFRFVQSQPNAHEPDQATLPMGAFEEAAEASERTQPQESFAPAPRAASAKRAQTIVEEPAEEAAAAEEEPVEEEHKEPRSEAEEAEEEEGSTRGSDEGEPEDAAAAAGGEPGEDDAPTQILPPDPSPAGSRAASARRPTLRKQDSSAMVDATLVEAEMEVFVTAPSVRRGRSSQAPTRADSEAATQILPPDMPVSMSVRRRSSRGAAAVAPAAAAPMGLDLHAYRVAASIGATMNDIDSSFNPSLGGSDDEDADVLPHSSDVKAMELDRTASSDATQVLPASSQAATQVMASESGDASSSAAAAAAAADISASISASLLGDLGCMGMATQTQVLPAFERVPSHLLAPPPSTGRATRKSSARSALYDDDESEDDARPNSKGRRAPSSAASSSSAAAAHSSAAFASPSASASPGGARTPASSSKKKRGRDEDDEPIIIEELPSEDEDDSAANKRKKVDRKPSKRGSVAAASSSAAAAAAAMESCPLCSESVPAARLESHVNSCLRAAAVDADAEAARKLAKELEAADAADAAARKSPAKRKPAARKPDWARDKELEERARAARASGRRVVYDGMEDRDWEADYRGDHSGDDEPIDDGLAPYDAYRAEREEEDGYAFGEHPSDEEEERSRAAAGFGSSRAAAGGRKGKYRVPPSAAAAAAAAAGSPASKKKKAAPSGPKTPCPLCSKSFFQSDLAEHADICEGADEDCPKCNKPFLPSMVKAHARTCAGPDSEFAATHAEAPLFRLSQASHLCPCVAPVMCALCEEMIGPKAYDAHVKRCIGRDSKACKLCNALFPEAEIAQHEKRCVQKEADMSQDEKMAIEIQRGEQQHELVSDVNTRAIKWVAEQAKRLSEAAMRPLLARFQKLGHSERDLKATIRYIRNDAPLIIHVNLTNCMKFFVADTHYRNQFETKTSCVRNTHNTLATEACGGNRTFSVDSLARFLVFRAHCQLQLARSGKTACSIASTITATVMSESRSAACFAAPL